VTARTGLDPPRTPAAPGRIDPLEPPELPLGPADLITPIALSALWLGAGILQPLGFVPTLAVIALLVVGAHILLSRRHRSSRPPRASVGAAPRTVVLAREFGLGAVAGLAGLVVTHAIARALFPLWPGGRAELGRLFAIVATDLPPALAIPATALIAVAEELLWRGLSHRALASKLPVSAAVAVGAAWYMICQAGLGAALPVAAALVLGTVTSLLRVWTGRLAASIGLHLVWTLGIVWVTPP
jgi:membrane protease YdiL (CAAX protease family)